MLGDRVWPLDINGLPTPRVNRSVSIGGSELYLRSVEHGRRGLRPATVCPIRQSQPHAAPRRGAKRRQLGLDTGHHREQPAEIDVEDHRLYSIRPAGSINKATTTSLPIPRTTLTIASDGRSGRMGGRAPGLLERLEGALMNLVPIILLIFAF